MVASSTHYERHCRMQEWHLGCFWKTTFNRHKIMKKVWKSLLTKVSKPRKTKQEFHAGTLSDNAKTLDTCISRYKCGLGFSKSERSIIFPTGRCVGYNQVASKVFFLIIYLQIVPYYSELCRSFSTAQRYFGTSPKPTVKWYWGWG